MKAPIKKDNKGFSLIELIIVVAIMAVLTAVLAPQFLKYVDKARRQNDVNSAYEMVNAIKILYTDDDANGNSEYSTLMAALYFNKNQLIEVHGSEEAYIESMRIMRVDGKKVIDADFYDIMGGIPESSLDENYTWFIGLKPEIGEVDLICLLDGNIFGFNKAYVLYPEHDLFMKGIGYTQEEIDDMLEDINNG